MNTVIAGCGGSRAATRFVLPRAGAAIAALTLAGCGGSGNSGPATTSAPPVVVSKDNSLSIVAAGYRAVGSLNEASLASGLLSGTTSPSGSFSLALFSANQLEYWAAAGAAAAGTVSCASGGSKTIQLTLASGHQTPSGGDIVKTTYTACRETADTTYDGTVSLSYIAVTGTPGSAGSTISAYVTYAGFTVTVGTAPMAFDGNVTFADNILSSTESSISFSGSSVSVWQNGSSETLSEFRFSLGLKNLNQNRTTGDYGYSGQGRLISATKLGGYVDFRTLSPLSGSIGSYPATGQLHVSAANNAAVLLTPTSATDVTVDIDVNGDGIYELSVMTTWANLAAF